MRSERNENIDIFKGVGIILVIAGHSIQRGLLGFDNSPVLFVELNKIIELFNMPLFFLISGWLFAKTGGGKEEFICLDMAPCNSNFIPLVHLEMDTMEREGIELYRIKSMV